MVDASMSMFDNSPEEDEVSYVLFDCHRQGFHVDRALRRQRQSREAIGNAAPIRSVRLRAAVPTRKSEAIKRLRIMLVPSHNL